MQWSPWELRKTPHAHPDPGQGRRLLAWACHDPLAHQSPLTSSLREGAGLGDLPTLTLNDYECHQGCAYSWWALQLQNLNSVLTNIFPVSLDLSCSSSPNQSGKKGKKRRELQAGSPVERLRLNHSATLGLPWGSDGRWSLPESSSKRVPIILLMTSPSLRPRHPRPPSQGGGDGSDPTESSAQVEYVQLLKDCPLVH